MTRIIWRRAHQVRLADRDTEVHRALWLSPLMEPRLGDHLARDLEAALLLEQDEKRELR